MKLMLKQCWNCKTTFNFENSDIKETQHTETKNRKGDKKPLIKRRFFHTDYSGIVTYNSTKYLVMENIIICPVCGKENRLCEIGREVVSENKYQEIENEVEMFGPNPPSIVGEREAVSMWLSH